MYYHFKFHKEDGVYWAQGIELKGCFSQGNTKEELQDNLEEALNLHLGEPEDSKTIFPLPKKTVNEKNILKVEVDSKVEIALLVRMARIKSNLTQKQAAEKAGLKVSSYQRYESPKKSNPTWETLKALREALPKLNDLFAI